ncbi:MAG TPA: hypothetical protein V6C65_37920 [Allocoleopsis sp.]
MIKGASIGLISVAIGLEVWHLSGLPISEETLNFLIPVYWIGRLGMAAHLIEAMIALVYAASRGKDAWRYSLYTFFVGAVGLVELFEQKSMVSQGDAIAQVDSLAITDKDAEQAN